VVRRDFPVAVTRNEVKAVQKQHRSFGSVVAERKGAHGGRSKEGEQRQHRDDGLVEIHLGFSHECRFGWLSR